MSKDIEDFTNEELVEQYYIVKRELENRNIEQSLPDYVSCEVKDE